MTRIRNKERPHCNSFYSTRELSACIKILALREGVSASDYIHSLVQKEVQTLLDGKSEEEFVSDFNAVAFNIYRKTQTQKTAQIA